MSQPSISKKFLHEFLYPAANNNRSSLAKIALGLILTAIAQAMFIFISGPFLQSFFLTPDSEKMIKLSEFLPKALANSNFNLDRIILSQEQIILYIPLFLIGAAAIKSYATYLFQYHQAIVCEYLAKLFREKMFSSILEQRYSETSKRSEGEWMSMIMNDVLFLQNRFSDIAKGLIKESIVVIASLATMAFIHRPTFITLIVVAPFLALGMGRIGKKIARYAMMWQVNLGKLASFFLNMRKRFPFVKAQKGEQFENQSFEVLNRHYYESIRKSILLRSAFAPVLEWGGLILLVAIFYAISHNLWGNFHGQEAVTFFVALGIVLKPIRNIGEQITRLQEVQGTIAKNLHSIDEANARKSAVSASETKPFSVPLSLSSVHCGREKPILIAESISLSPGKAVAIIGPSGAGKSTFIKTLAGLLEPLKWEGTLDWRTLAANTSFVSQRPFLFNDSIQENIAYGRTKEVAYDEMRQVLTYADLGTDFDNQTLSLNMRIKNFSTNLSGGQIQRLNIARGLLHNSNVWLFDEITASLDAMSEKKITMNVVQLCKSRQKVLLMITHRLQWLDQFDEIWFFENGKITFRGSYEDLQNSARYRAFNASQQN